MASSPLRSPLGAAKSKAYARARARALNRMGRVFREEFEAMAPRGKRHGATRQAALRALSSAHHDEWEQIIAEELTKETDYLVELPAGRRPDKERQHDHH